MNRIGEYHASVDITSLYPRAPEAAIDVETRPGYRLRVALVVAALALFLAVYFGLIGVAAWVLVYLFTHGAPELMSILLAAADAMLLAFLLKGLFKRTQVAFDSLVPVEEAEQPELFAFVRRVCEEARCGFPRRVYLSHEVNASVFRRASLLRVFLPERQSLHIGAGLVNALTLSELKAVLAHEFGHFAQSSTRLGQHVYLINRVIYDMVVARDSWDRALAHWRRIDVRVSFPAWILTAVVWTLRKSLEQMCKLLNLASPSLSRAMEFDADSVAVRLAGSDAIVGGLWKCERAGIALNETFRMLASLADHGKYTSDLFHHQIQAERRFQSWLETKQEDSPYLRSLRTPYRDGQAIHFQEGDDNAPSMWATHPSNRDREIEAKRRYLSADPIQDTAWRLFREAPALRCRLTRRAYARVLGKEPKDDLFQAPEEIEALARAEREEVEQAPHYRGLYKNRFVEPGDVDALASELDAGVVDEAALRAEVVPWTGAALAKFFDRVDREESENGNLRETLAKAGKKKSLASETKLLLDQNEARLKAAGEEMRAADRAIFRYFYAVSGRTPEGRARLLERYRFLLAVQGFILKLNAEDRRLGSILAFLQKQRELNKEQFRQVASGFAEVQEALREIRKDASTLRVPQLAHMNDATSVQEFVLPELPDEHFGGDKIDGAQINRLSQLFGQALGRLRKLHFKNLGALLKLQEQLDPSLFPSRAVDLDKAGRF